MSTPETDTPTDDDAPRDTLSDTPLDAAQRLGLARFRLGSDAPAWLLETLAFARDEANRMTRERDAAREIINGRATPPTDAEIAVHAARGGVWRTRYVVGEAALSRDVMGADSAGYVRDAAQRQHAYLWWALDAHGRPCAWPEVQS